MTTEQKEALTRLCGRYEVEFKEENFGPALGSITDWVEGWVGKHIYIGCSPEGAIHS